MLLLSWSHLNVISSPARWAPVYILHTALLCRHGWSEPGWCHLPRVSRSSCQLNFAVTVVDSRYYNLRMSPKVGLRPGSMEDAVTSLHLVSRIVITPTPGEYWDVRQACKIIKLLQKKHDSHCWKLSFVCLVLADHKRRRLSFIKSRYFHSQKAGVFWY